MTTSRARSSKLTVAWIVGFVLVLASCSSTSSSSGTQGTSATPLGTAYRVAPGSTASTSTVKHVFIINLENESYDNTFGPSSKAVYLNNSLVPKGKLLSQYYGIGHASLDNYIAQISGQAPNPTTQADCQKFVDFTMTATVAPG